MSAAPGGISRTYATERVAQALRLLIGLPRSSSMQAAVEVRARLDRALAAVQRPRRCGRSCGRSTSTASSSTHTSKASTVPPGKKWPMLRVRTTTSTRAESPRRSAASALVERRHHRRRPRGARSRPRPGRRLLRRRRTCWRAAARRPPPAGLERRRAGSSPGTRREDVDRHDVALQELLGDAELLVVAVHERQRGVGRREAVRVHLAVASPPGRSTPPAACGSRRTSAAWAGSRTSARPGPTRPWPASCRSR